MKETVTISLERFKKMEQAESGFYGNVPCYLLQDGYSNFKIYSKEETISLMNTILDKRKIEIQELKDENVRCKEKLVDIRWYKPWTWIISFKTLLDI